MTETEESCRSKMDKIIQTSKMYWRRVRTSLVVVVCFTIITMLLAFFDAPRVWWLSITVVYFLISVPMAYEDIRVQMELRRAESGK
jgi:O-antigen/teichoic acid export membrane protein